MSSKRHYGSSAFYSSYFFNQIIRSRVFDNFDDACEIICRQKMRFPYFARMKNLANNHNKRDSTPLRSVIFQRDPDFESAPERRHQVYVMGRQPAPLNWPWFPSSLSLSHRPPFLIVYDMPHSFYVFAVGETFLRVCSRARPGSWTEPPCNIRCYHILLERGAPP
jgi:hypothetical protein